MIDFLCKTYTVSKFILLIALAALYVGVRIILGFDEIIKKEPVMEYFCYDCLLLSTRPVCRKCDKSIDRIFEPKGQRKVPQH